MSSEDPVASAPPNPGESTQRTVVTPDTLRDRIVEHLRVTGTDSISGIARHLSGPTPGPPGRQGKRRGAAAPVHRLTTAGYLQALTEMGVLRELDRPPSKLYQLANPEAHWSLHQRIHRALQDTPRPEPDRIRLALAALQRALGRPIFQAELVHAGFPIVPDDLRRVVVGDATRRAYRELFQRRSSPRIHVPPRDPLLGLADDDPLLSSDAVGELLRRILVKAAGADHLVAERPPGPQQAQLEFGGRP